LQADCQLNIVYHIFDVRSKNEVPDLSYDAYISSGGPGSPIDSAGSIWEEKILWFDGFHQRS
jgi:homoserine O-succinyltransferase